MRSIAAVWLFSLGVGVGMAQRTAAAAQASSSLTIYNQNFAVVRTPVALDLKAGMNQVEETDVTAQVEPDSVVLRDMAGRRAIPVLEQNYDGALRVQAQMLAKFEGQTIDFAMGPADNLKTVPGKIVRAGSVPQFDLLDRFGQQYFYQTQQQGQQQEPLIEIEGKLRYGLPGTPLFPSEAPGLTLRPTLRWLIASDKPVKIAAELDYITRGLRWDATYNVIAPAEDVKAGERLEVSGWVNITNESGMDFREVSLQLMAGDISKLVNQNGQINSGMAMAAMDSRSMGGRADKSRLRRKASTTITSTTCTGRQPCLTTRASRLSFSTWSIFLPTGCTCMTDSN